MRVKNIAISGYKALHSVDPLPLRGLNVLIGPNGAGKTSFMDVFVLLSEAMREGLGNGLSERGGVNDLITRDKAERVQIDLEVESLRSEPLKYAVTIGAKANDYVIEREELTQLQVPHPGPFVFLTNRPGHCLFHDYTVNALRAPTWEFKDRELGLAQVPRTYKEPEELRRTLNSVGHYNALDVSRRAPVRLPQDLKPVDIPGPNGEDLFAFLYSLRSNHNQLYQRLEEVLGSCFPGFQRLDFPLVGKGQATLAWYEQSFRKPIYQNQLSEGILRFIWFAALLLSPTLPKLTLIDEPEISLHPELLRVLSSLLQEASDRSQIVVATHADRLVRWLTPEEIVLADKEEGCVRLRRAESVPNVKDWLEKYSIDQLWLMGELGAKP